MNAIDAWRERDAQAAIHPKDRAAIDATEAARSLVLELLAARPADAPPSSRSRETRERDLWSACARLGRLLADAGASPTLAVTTMDGAAAALGDAGTPVEPARLASARASVAEGYLAVALEAERAQERRAWEYPACAIRLDPRTAAILAGYPGDEGEGLGDWAARVALGASRDGVKEAVLSGGDAAKKELSAALSLIGIEVRTGVHKSTWLDRLWRK